MTFEQVQVYHDDWDMANETGVQGQSLRVNENGDVKCVTAPVTKRGVDRLWKRFAAASSQLDEHPEDWDGPCFCRLCMSYKFG